MHALCILLLQAFPVSLDQYGNIMRRYCNMIYVQGVCVHHEPQ